MPYGDINANLSEQDLVEIKEAIATIHSHLPFLINLTVDERRRRFKMGDKSLAFVRNSIRVTQNNPELIPSNFNADGFAQDYELAAALSEVLVLLQQLTEKVDDTLLAVGSESMASSLLVYDYVKAAAKYSPGLKSIAEQLGERFKLPYRRRSPQDMDATVA